jgi:HEAT repeat protein
LKDENPAVRLPAVQTLWEFESKDLSRIFLNMMVNDTDGLVRASAAAGLGRFVFDGEVDKLSRNILKDLENQLIQVVNGKDEKQVRLRALESLGFSENPDVIPLIESAYRSTDNDWIAASLLAMGRSADNQWDAKVLKMLDSPISQLCTEAARAAGELEIHQAVPQLLELLEDEDEDTRLASVWALALIGGEGIREALEEMIETCDSEDEQDFIIEALEQLVFTEDRSILSFSDFEDADDLDY